MTDFELFDTGSVHDDAQHWDALASRVVAEAMMRRGSVLQWLAGSRAAALGMAFVLAALAVLLSATEAVRDETNIREQWTRLMAPSDSLGRTIATESGPPSLWRLLDDARGSSR